jgi:branched-subunit amino acid aminotransferase/4-amino-4-deoxychorismate lyase
VAYVRPSAHLKHTGTFGRDLHGQAARRKGFDDALLVAPDGQVAETSIANIGFVRAGRVVWPTGPALHGITWQLLDLVLAAAGTPATAERIRVDDKRAYDGAFLTSSLGVAPVGRIGTHPFADPGVTAFVADLYASVPWDVL